jgi:hypothetical protein
VHLLDIGTSFSARFASSFMNEMRVASMALAAYLSPGGAHIHHQHALVVALKRRVQSTHDLSGLLVSALITTDPAS